MKLKNITEKIQQIAPPNLAQKWDNTGLLIGDSNKNVKSIMLTIDVTKQVLAEAKKNKTDLIVSYHPVIWDGLKKITANDPNNKVFEIIRSDIAVYSVHTTLDVISGGVNDGLAEIVGIRRPKPIGDYVENPAEDIYKLVVFIPINAVKKVSDALFAAGAGTMGNYSNCSFKSEGTGTFLPLNNAEPAVGQRGKLQNVPEVKFETIVTAEKLQKAITAMKNAHPYETPAFDCLKMHNPRTKTGLGRIGKLNRPATLKTIVRKIKKYTGAKTIGFIGPEKKLVNTAAVCAGSCGKIINAVINAKTDLYVTGELKHHQALAAQQAKLTCLCLSHTVSERFILKKFAERLKKQLENVNVKISRKDADPFQWKKI